MEKKTRGFWTTLVLVLYIIGSVLSIISAATNKAMVSSMPEELVSSVPQIALSSGMIVYTIISGIIVIAITIGIFMWKKVAIYALAIYQPLSFIISLIVADYSVMTTVIGTIIGGVIGIAIAYLIVFSLLKKIKYNEEIEDSMNV